MMVVEGMGGGYYYVSCKGSGGVVANVITIP